MGVKRLNSFIINNKYANIYDSIKKFVKNNKNMVAGIDVLLFAHKYKYSYDNIVYGFWLLCTKLLSNGITPLCIFDGKPPIEKKDVLLKRSHRKAKLKNKLNMLREDLSSESSDENKNKINRQIEKLDKKIINITKDDLNQLKYFLDTMEITYLEAQSEADYLCGKLYKEGIIDVCLSDDMDMLAHGCGRLIKIKNGRVTEFDLDKILRKLKITYIQFIDMCILFGCDYVKTIPKLKPQVSYRLIKEYKTIENISQHFFTKEHKYFMDNFKKAKRIFLTKSSEEIIPENLSIKMEKKLNQKNILTALKHMCPIFITDEQQIIEKIEKINELLKI